LASIPVSIAIELPNGFSTDFPCEPIMGGLMLIFFVNLLFKKDYVKKEFLMHPIIFFLFLQLAWAVVSTCCSTVVYYSFKYCLAKTWYVAVGVFLTAMLIKTMRDKRQLFWWMYLPLTATILIILLRHAMNQFSFDSINDVVEPFYINHVMYAIMVTIFFPFLWFATSWYKKGTFNRQLLLLSRPLYLVAIWFSFTRSAWAAILGCALCYFIIQLKLLQWVFSAFMAGVLIIIIYLSIGDRYLAYAPNYNTTIYHNTLGAHLVATYEMEDLSNAERIYRWVAGLRMWQDRPVVGFGPSTFYSNYKAYTVSSFMTYVSDNPEQSTVHNYFLLMLDEQGVPGLLIFIALSFVLFQQGQRIYHETKDKDEKNWVMATILCLIAIFITTFLSDIIETLKAGPLFFMSMAFLVNQDIRNKKLLKEAATEKTDVVAEG
jgi:O-antigen ligase